MTDSPQNGLTDFIICLKDPSAPHAAPAPIGKIGIFSPTPSNEIGFLLSRPHWHKGLAYEALAHMLAYLFNLRSPATPQIDASASDVHTAIEARPSSAAEQYTTLTAEESRSKWWYPSITADTDPRNSASINLLKKAGFVESGYLERSMQIGGEGGEWVDSLYLKLERDVWLSRNQKEKER